MTRALRQSTMMSPRQVRGTVLAVLLCSALAGCGSVAASAPAGAGATSSASATSAAQDASSAPASSSSATPAAAASATGCASVDQATSVTVHRVLHLVEPTRAGALSKTQHNATLVRALFRQLCAAVSHPAKGATLHCPANFGISYLGTFYDGSRTLAKFDYGASGCQLVSLTVGGKTRTTMVVGTASAAAPKLRADLAAVLGVPRLAIAQPVTGTGKSGATH
jgi:hypothetical protein